MEMVLPVVFLLLVLFLVGRGRPVRQWLVIVAGTLAFVVGVVLIERAGLWPRSWTVR